MKIRILAFMLVSCLALEAVQNPPQKSQPTMTPDIAQQTLWNTIMGVDFSGYDVTTIQTLQRTILQLLTNGADLIVEIDPVPTDGTTTVTPITINLLNPLVKATQGMSYNSSALQAFNGLIGAVLKNIGTDKATTIVSTQDITGLSPLDLVGQLKMMPQKGSYAYPKVIMTTVTQYKPASPATGN